MTQLIWTPGRSAHTCGWVKGSINFNESITQINLLVQIGTRSRRTLDVMTEWPTPTEWGVNPWTWDSVCSIAETLWAAQQNTGRKLQQCNKNYEITKRDRLFCFFSFGNLDITAHPPLFPIVGRFVFAIVRKLLTRYKFFLI